VSKLAFRLQIVISRKREPCFDTPQDGAFAESPGTANRLLLNDGHGRFRDLPNALPAKPWGIDSEGLAVLLDLNGDGHVDLLVGYTKNNPFYVGRWIQVLVDNGDGTFRDKTAARLPQRDNAATWPYAIQVADLNGDGKPDIGVSLFPTTESPPFYLNQGNGRFVPMPTSAFASPPSGMFAFLDANRDRHVDVLSAQSSTGSMPKRHYLAEQAVCRRRPHKRCR
jgi:hypothetical protein